MPVAGQVSSELERSVVELLEAKSDAIIPLSHLQSALEALLAKRAPGPASLIAGIRRRPDLFLVIAHDDNLPGAEIWPRELRERYDIALSDAGVRPEMHIALRRDVSNAPAATGDSRDVIRELQHSVLRLWRVRENQPAPGLDGVVTLVDTVRVALDSNSNAQQTAPPLVLEVLDQ
jgi:hypothetical protein